MTRFKSTTLTALAVLILSAWPASADECVSDASWNAAENGYNGTGNATHAQALYRSLITFKVERTTERLPVWRTRHGTQPTTTITAAKVREVRGKWSGWDKVLTGLDCLEARAETEDEVVAVEPEPIETSASSQSAEVTVVYPDGATSVEEGWQVELEGATSCPYTTLGPLLYPPASNNFSYDTDASTPDRVFCTYSSFRRCTDPQNLGTPQYTCGGYETITSVSMHQEDNNRVEGDRTLSFETRYLKRNPSDGSAMVNINVTDDDVAYIYLYTRNTGACNQKSDGRCVGYANEWWVQVSKPIVAQDGPQWWETDDFVHARIALVNVSTRDGETRSSGGSSIFTLPANKSGTYRLFDRPLVGPATSDIYGDYQLGASVNFPNCHAVGGDKVEFKSLKVSVSKQIANNYKIRVRTPPVDTDLCNP